MHEFRILTSCSRLCLKFWYFTEQTVLQCVPTLYVRAACGIGFFGFLRAGEFTCPSWRAYNPDLLTRDISLDSHEQPAMVSVHLRRSETDTFGEGVSILLRADWSKHLPSRRPFWGTWHSGQQPGPLFLYRDGSPLSRRRLMRRIAQVVESHGIDTAAYSRHSFRIGAAATIESMGFGDSYIQTLVRWRSNASNDTFSLPLRRWPQHPADSYHSPSS